jgi:hypothetical protein
MDLQGSVTATFFKGHPTFLNGKLSAVYEARNPSGGR